MLDRLGVGYERMREANPAIVFCAITGYGQDGPYAQRAGHDMNYLGLVGLLGLTGAKDGPPVQSAGQIADLGGGGLMAAFGVMAALHERQRSGEGQLVDVSMADGALSWLAMVAGRYFCDGEVPRRGEQQLAGGLLCYLPYEVADGWVSCGALEPKFWAAFCNGVGRPDLIEKQFEAPGLATPGARSPRSSARRTRDEWLAFNDEHDCCIEPILDLDEALDSELVRAREMVVELDQPELGKVRQLGVPVKLSRTPGDPTRPAPAFGEHTEEVLREAGYSDGGDRGDARVRRRRRPRRRGRRRRSSARERRTRPPSCCGWASWPRPPGVPAPTIKHYLREGLLPEPVKTSRNMAYYPPEFVDRIRLIKRLQEERFMPLKAIKVGARRGPRAGRGDARARGPDPRPRPGRRARPDQRRRGAQALRRPQGGARPPRRARGPDPEQPRLLALRHHIIEAISRFRAGGYDEQIGFTVYDTLRYKTALEELVQPGGRRW